MSNTLNSINPVTNQSIGSVDITPCEHIANTVTRARNAQQSWANLSISARITQLKKLSNHLSEKQEQLAQLITQEMGKPIKESRQEILLCHTNLTGYLDEIEQALTPQVKNNNNTESVMYYDPLGVCAVITPWNFPFSLPHGLIIAALAAGNAVIFKPSEETPLSGQAYADLLHQILPPDLVHIIHGSDDQGKALVAQPIDLIAFIGSQQTGKKIMAAASEHLTRIILELGGKDPMIVLEDANIEKAACYATENSFRNAGQVCISTERIYVHEKVIPQFIETLVRETNKIQLGNGMDEATDIGPMVNQTQKNHVLSQIEDAKNKGATIVLDGSNQENNFMAPTILSNIDHDMRIAKEETFGPVACITSISDDDEAVALANDTTLGLGAVVFGQDDHAKTVARHLTAGMIGVNQGCRGVKGTPWIGAKQSGYGYYHSTEGHRQFTQIRVITTRSVA